MQLSQKIAVDFHLKQKYMHPFSNLGIHNLVQAQTTRIECRSRHRARRKYTNEYYFVDKKN